jgi:hypothetical protein
MIIHVISFSNLDSRIRYLDEFFMIINNTVKNKKSILTDLHDGGRVMHTCEQGYPVVSTPLLERGVFYGVYFVSFSILA